MSTDIIARLKLRAEEFSRTLKSTFSGAEADAEIAGRQIGTRLGRGLQLASVGVSVGVAVLATAIQRSVEYADGLKKVSDATGMSTRALQEYGYAAGKVGVAQADLNDGLRELTSKVAEARAGGKGVAGAFAELGVSLKGTGGEARDVGGIFNDLIGKISGVRDPVERARIGAEIFGGQWEKLAPLLTAGTARVDDLRGSLEKYGVVLSDEDIRRAGQLAQEWRELNDALGTKIRGVVLENAGAILEIANAIGAATLRVGDFLGTTAAAREGVERRDLRNLMVLKAREHPDIKRLSPAAREQAYALLERRADARYGVVTGPDSWWGRLSLPAEPAHVRRRRAAPRPAPQSPPPETKLNPRPASSSSRGGSKKSAIDSEAKERASAAERALEAEQRLREELEETIREQEDSARIARIRAEQGEVAARIAEAELRLKRQFPMLEAETAQELGRQLGLSAEQIKLREKELNLLRERYAVAKDSVKKEVSDQVKIELGNDGLAANDAINTEMEQRHRDRIEDLAGLYRDVFDRGTDAIWDEFYRRGLDAITRLAAKQTLKLLGGTDLAKDLVSRLGIDKSALKELGAFAGYGGMAASLTGGSGLGGMAGGALGGALGKEVLGKALGSFAGPLGSIAGGIIGGLVGGIFKKHKIGYATIGADASGGLAVTGTGGNNGSRREWGQSGADSVIAGLEQIAAELGGRIDATRGRVSIGISGDSYHVDTSGQGRLKKSQGGKDFNQDAEAAIAYAMMDLIKDGVLVGLRASTARLLQDSNDLQEALQKALSFESVFKELKRIKDPVGAAIDELNAQFDALIKLAKEAGASAEEMAQMEELYGIKRKEAVEAALGGTVGQLKDFLASLKAGPESYLSLRDQRANAEAALDPFRTKIAAGQAVDVDAFQQAVATALDIERQISGGTASYFDRENELTTMVQKVIGQAETRSASAESGRDPFAELTAQATQASANILDQQTDILARIEEGISSLAQGRAPNATFLTAGRGFQLKAV